MKRYKTPFVTWCPQTGVRCFSILIESCQFWSSCSSSADNTTVLKCCSVVGYFSTFRGNHISFIFKAKQFQKSPLSYIIWRFWTSLGMLNSAARPLETLVTAHLLTEESHLRRLVSSNWSQSKATFLFTTVGCFHPCHMTVTQSVVPSKIWPITLPYYHHQGNFKPDLKSFPRKCCVIAVGSPCVNILSIYAMCSFFNLMDNFRHETWQQDEVVPLSCYRNGSNYNSVYNSVTQNSAAMSLRRNYLVQNTSTEPTAKRLLRQFRFSW